MDPVVLNFPIREGANVDGEYERFIIELRETLANHPERENYITRYGEWLRGHPLLPVQQSIQPPRWIHINLLVQDEDGVEKMRTTIAVRDDNVFFQGFKNQNGQWYEFGKTGESTHFIAGSTLLGCDVGYRDLVGDSANFLGLRLTKHHLIEAVRRLSGYQEVKPANSDAKLDLARICVIICESARMIPHRNAVSYRWRNHDQSGISLEQVQNMKDWSKMSSYLLNTPDPSPVRTNLLGIVHLLFNKVKSGNQATQHQQEQAPVGGGGSSQQGPGSSNPQMPRTSSGPPTSGSGSGGGAQEQTGQTGGKSIRTKPLVQVFSVKVDLDVIGSIVVFDGKRGQIIYKNRARSHRSVFLSFILGKLFGNQRTKPLPLTGPYKAISAEGCFVIQVRDITSATDESSRVIGEMLCDCYADNVDYDKVLIGSIISTGTGRQKLATVFYAVLRDAVEATVEVNLLLPGNTSVYGKINACYPELQYNEVVLFERGRDEKLELAPSAAGSMVPLELGRSVIAVPFSGRYSRVQIYVDLTVVQPNEVRDVILQGGVTLFLDKHTGEIRVGQHGDIPDATGGDGASGSGSGQGTGQTTVQQCKIQLNITSPGFHVSPLEPESRQHIGITSF